MVHTRFQQLHFNQRKLVVQTLELAEKGSDKSKGVKVGLLLHVDGDQPGLEVLSKERSSLCNGPVYAGFDHIALEIERVGDFAEQVQELAN